MKKTSLRGNGKTTLLPSPLGLFATALALCLLCLNGSGNIAFAKSDGDGGTVANKSARDEGDAASKKSTGSNANSETTANNKSTDPKAATPSTEDQLLQLNEKVKRLEMIIEQQQKAMDALQNQMKGGPTAPVNAAATTSPGDATAGAPGTVQPVAASAGATATTAATTAKSSTKDQDAEAPLQLHIGAATITPIGFVDFTGVFRSTTTGAGIGTNFGNVPFSNTQAGNLTEFRFSPQNSRLGARFDADVHGAHVLGYFETDFLGFVPTNAAVSSHSFSERIRLAWVDVRKDKWEVLGGQSWSLMTPNRNGVSPLPGDVFYSQDMDTNYQVGLTWTRAAGFRFAYHPSDSVAFAVALEDPEQYIGGSGGGGGITLTSALNGSTIGSEFNNGGTTLNTPNVAPDVIAKLAFDPKVGDKHFHIEFVGLERNFKSYNPLTKNSFNATGGGGAINFNLELFKGFRLISNNYYSDGGGRYLFGEAPDFVLRADGSPSLLHAYSAIEGFEAQVNPKTLFFAYYGGDYIQKNLIIDPATGHAVGYGFPGSSSGNNRTIQEATFGLNQTFWKDPKFGALSLILQYSYLIRSPWVRPSTGPDTASINMFWVDLRYTLPGQSPHY